jgi:hypothetical protein
MEFFALAVILASLSYSDSKSPRVKTGLLRKGEALRRVPFLWRNWTVRWVAASQINFWISYTRFWYHPVLLSADPNPQVCTSTRSYDRVREVQVLRDQVQSVPNVSKVEVLRSGYVILTCLDHGLTDQLNSVLKTRGLQILSRKYWNDVSIYQI